MNSLEIRKFSQSIINFTNESELPLEVKRLCFAEILQQIENASNKQISAEIMEKSVREEKSSEQNLQSHQLGELSE